ncbi:MAG: hypothetical protein RR842_09545, partial [Gordonibacter sp.]|uniref:ComF family protein n=1 Tax=Gordonibacter sp. TaxID=1968902 RepID=UPI002FC8E1FF
LSVPEMQRVLNMKKGQIEKALKYMTVESPSPIVKIDTKWHSTPAAESYQVDQEFIRSITSIRKAEQQQMQNYMEHEGCLMAFLQNALDDPSSMVCKKCKNCNPNAMLDESCDDELINRASLFLRRSYLPLNVRKQWPSKDMFEHYDFEGARIPSDLQAEEGRALSLWRDAGWGNLVAEGKYTDETFPDELVAACVELMKHWGPEPAPEWVTCIPSLSRPNLVKNFAVRLAGALEIPFAPCIEKVCNNAQQKKMENSYKQAKNLDGVFSIKRECLHDGPCLLVDDIVDSGWTFTVAVALLRQAGCSAVFPLALALNSPRMD